MMQTRPDGRTDDDVLSELRAQDENEAMEEDNDVMD